MGLRVRQSVTLHAVPGRDWMRDRLYTGAVTPENPFEPQAATATEQPAVPKLRFGQRMALAVVPPVAALVIRLLGMTLRYEDRAEPGVTPGYAIPGPTVFAFWHRSLLASAHRFKDLDIAILISPSFDGELIARTVELLGFKAVRGSSSRGGAAGLRNMQAAYAAGHRCAITADGPRGPKFVAKPGAAQLANSVVEQAGSGMGGVLLCAAGAGMGAEVMGQIYDPQAVLARGADVAGARPGGRGDD